VYVADLLDGKCAQFCCLCRILLQASLQAPERRDMGGRMSAIGVPCIFGVGYGIPDLVQGHGAPVGAKMGDSDSRMTEWNVFSGTMLPTRFSRAGPAVRGVSLRVSAKAFSLKVYPELEMFAFANIPKATASEKMP